MSVAEAVGRASAGASLGIGRLAARRRIEVRVTVSDVEEDAFAASRPETLVGALKPILRHLDGRTTIQMVGVERSAVLFRSVERRQPLADLSEAMTFLGRG